LVRRRGGPSDGDTIQSSFDSIVPPQEVSRFPMAERQTPRAGRRRRQTADFARDRPKAPARAARKRRDTADFKRDTADDKRDTAPHRRRKDTADFEPEADIELTLDTPHQDLDDLLPEQSQDESPPRDTLVDGPNEAEMKELVRQSAARDDIGGWGDLSEPSPVDSIARRAARAHSILPQRLPTAPEAALVGLEMGPRALGDLSAVLATIRAAKTRDEVCRHACRGLAPLGRSAVLLVLSRGILKGQEVVGGDLPRDAVHNLWIPSTSRSLLARVLETGEPYLGPHGQSSADAVFRAALGSRGGDVLLAPIVLSGRAVAVLALDEPVADSIVLLERAEVLCRATADAFRRLIVASKAHHRHE
jgi:hypothetical protein